MDRREFARLVGGGIAAIPIVASGWGNARAASAQDDKLPVWIDTDIGADIDDAVCLLCAIRHPQVEVVGVSTVRGCIGSVLAAAWVAREMLQRAQLPHVPVLPGALTSLSGDGPAPDHLGTYGTLALPLDPIRISPKWDDSRVDAIAEAMRAVGKPFHLLTIGALTNAARIAVRHPAVARQWQTVTCMAGRLTGEAECNARLDVEGTRIVCERLNPRLVGMECGAVLSREEAEAALDPSDPCSAFLLECYSVYRAHADWCVEEPDRRPLTLIDAIAFLSIVHPELFDFQSMHIEVKKDGRLRRSDAGLPVVYAVSSDWAALKPLIIALLRGEAL